MNTALTWIARRMLGRVKKNNRKTYYVCMLPVFKCVTRDLKKKYYILGVCVFQRYNTGALRKSMCEVSELRRQVGELNKAVDWYHTVLYHHFEHKLHNKQDYILLMDCLYDKDAEAIDAWSMFQYLKAENIPAKYVLKEDNALAESAGNAPDVILVKSNQDFFYNHTELIAGSCCVLTSFGISVHLDRFMRKLPFLRYIFIEHGPTFMKPNVIRFYNPMGYNMILASTRRTLDMYREQKYWKEEDIIHCGMPRWDLLARTPHAGKNIFIFFTWRSTFSREPEKAQTYFKRMCSFLTNPHFQNLVHREGIHVRVAFHHALLYFNLPLPELGDDFELVDSRAISRYISSSDLLITDYSSLCFDFMFLDIPVLFYRFDFDDKRLNDEDQQCFHYARSRDQHLYNCAYDEESAVRILERYASNDFVLEAENKQKNEAFFWERCHVRQHLYGKLKSIACTPTMKQPQQLSGITV